MYKELPQDQVLRVTADGSHTIAPKLQSRVVLSPLARAREVSKGKMFARKARFCQCQVARSSLALTAESI